MIKRITVYFCLIILIAPKVFSKDFKIGTTFSQVQCEYLNLDWKNTYKEVVSMGFDIIRLGAYWNRIEKEEGRFDFSELDWQIKLAKEKNLPILFTVGMKAPRWPEYFFPDWLLKKVNIKSSSAVSDKPIIRKKTLEFIRKVVERYKNEDLIIAWQVENEPLSRSGPKELWIRPDFLKEEIKLVKKLDQHPRPVVLNAMTYSNWFLRMLNRLTYSKNPIYQTIAIAEIAAINVYPAIGQKIIGAKICFWTEPKGRMAYLRRFVNKAREHNKPLWVTELQAEPWDPGELVHLNEKKSLTCHSDNFLMVFSELHSLGIDTIFVWGVEYWLYRSKNFQDNSWIKAYNQIRNKNKSQ